MSRWKHAVEATVADVRFAARRLRAEPLFLATASVTLALGLGAATAIFSAIKPVLLEPLPFAESSRLVMLWEVAPDGTRTDATFGMYREVAARGRSFESLAAFRPWQPVLASTDQPERLEAQRVTASYWDVLRVAPALGRGFDADDDRPGAPGVVLLSDGLWRRRFGGDPGVVGSTITLDDEPHRIGGVLPAGFESMLAPTAELWAPLQYDLGQGRAWGHHLRTVGRLRPGADPATAATEARAIGQTLLAEQRPTTYGDAIDFVAIPLRDDLVREARPALLAFLGAVALLLVVATVNVANLMLARDGRRADEIALRLALGAGLPRLTRQLMTESLLVALAGAALATPVALFGVRTLRALAPPDLPRAGEIRVDVAAALLCFALALLIGSVLGVTGALRARSRTAGPGLPRSARHLTRPAGAGARALVSAEVALALVLLIGAGLLVRSLERLFAVDPGFRPDRLLTLQVQTTGNLAADSATLRFAEAALATVRQLPGVQAAAWTSQLPLSGDVDLYGVHLDPPPARDLGEPRGAYRYAVSPGWFEAMGTAIVRGRALEASDRAGAPLVAVISASLAARRLPGVDPLGQRLRIGSGPLYTVVGVAADVRQESLALDDGDAVYVTMEQWRFADRALSLVVRTAVQPAAFAGTIRDAIRSIDPGQPIVRMAAMSELVAASAAERRFALHVLRAFALAALLLAATGVYGVLAGSVAARILELGVRAALGASRPGLVGLVLRSGLVLSFAGVGVGLPIAVLATRGIRGLLYGVEPLDVGTYVAVVVLLAGTSVAAAALPAWRAARVDPADTLRQG